LINVAVRHQFVGLVAHIGDFDGIVTKLPAQCEVPLLAVSGGEVVGPSIDVEKSIVESAVSEADRRETLNGPQCGRGI